MHITVTGERCSSVPFLYIESLDLRGTQFLDFKQDLDLNKCKVPSGRPILRHFPKADHNMKYGEIRFKPPLRHGQEATVVLNEAYRCSHVAHKQYLLNCMDKGDLLYQVPLERSGMHCVAPARRLINRICMPRGYDPEDFDFSATLLGILLPEETARLKRTDAFSVDLVDDQWVCCLHVVKPVTGAVYTIHWIPPEKKDYEQLLLNPHKRKMVSGTKVQRRKTDKHRN